MNDAESKPRSSIEQVEEQHEGIRNTIASIHRALSTDEASTLEISSQLSAFCVLLDDHFQTEEKEGFFDQIVEQAPRLSPHADKLCEEHQQMLDEVKTLVKQGLDSDSSPEARSALEAAFHELSKRLMRHEGEENDLLQQAYTDDIGDKD